MHTIYNLSLPPLHFTLFDLLNVDSCFSQLHSLIYSVVKPVPAPLCVLGSSAHAHVRSSKVTQLFLLPSISSSQEGKCSLRGHLLGFHQHLGPLTEEAPGCPWNTHATGPGDTCHCPTAPHMGSIASWLLPDWAHHSIFLSTYSLQTLSLPSGGLLFPGGLSLFLEPSSLSII